MQSLQRGRALIGAATGSIGKKPLHCKVGMPYSQRRVILWTLLVGILVSCGKDFADGRGPWPRRLSKPV